MAMICAICEALIDEESVEECPNCGKDDQKLVFVSTNYRALKNMDGHCSTCGSTLGRGKHCFNCNRISEPSRERAKDDSDQKDCRLCGEPITGKTQPNQKGFCKASCMQTLVQVNLQMQQCDFYDKAIELFALKITKIKRELASEAGTTHTIEIK